MRLAVLLVLGLTMAIVLAPERAGAAPPVDACPMVEVIEDADPATPAIAPAGAPAAARPPLGPAAAGSADPANAPPISPPVPPPER